MLKNGEYGRNTAKIRKSRNMTQEALAEEAGLSIQCVQTLERGQSNATVDTLMCIAAVLQIDWRILGLLGWKDEEIRESIYDTPRLSGTPEDVLGFGQNILLLRKANGLTQKELACLAGVSLSRLRDIEHGCANATIGTLERIAAALGTTLPELATMSIPEEMLLDMVGKARRAANGESAEDEMPLLV